MPRPLRILQSELVVFEESGHAPFWEEPEKFNREIARFADEASRRDG